MFELIFVMLVIGVVVGIVVMVVTPATDGIDVKTVLQGIVLAMLEVSIGC